MRKKFLTYLSFMLGLTFSQTVMGNEIERDESSPSSEKSDNPVRLTVILSNDFFVPERLLGLPHQDWDYSTGTYIQGTWTPHSLNGSFLRNHLTLGVGQDIYTPKDTSISELQENDRRYVGWLNVGAAWSFSIPKVFVRGGVTAGTIGPRSGAEHTQEIAHRLLGTEDSQGWQH